MEKKGPLNEMKGRLFYVGTGFISKTLFGGLTTSGEPSGDVKGVSSHPRSSTESHTKHTVRTLPRNDFIQRSHPRTTEASGIFTTTGRILFYNRWKRKFWTIPDVLFRISWMTNSFKLRPRRSLLFFSNFLKLWDLRPPWVESGGRMSSFVYYESMKRKLI
jgi:hypothetical protein